MYAVNAGKNTNSKHMHLPSIQYILGKSGICTIMSDADYDKYVWTFVNSLVKSPLRMPDFDQTLDHFDRCGTPIDCGGLFHAVKTKSFNDSTSQLFQSRLRQLHAITWKNEIPAFLYVVGEPPTIAVQYVAEVILNMRMLKTRWHEYPKFEFEAVKSRWSPGTVVQTKFWADESQEILKEIET